MQDPRNTREPRVGAGIGGLVSHSVPDLAVFSDIGALSQIMRHPEEKKTRLRLSPTVGYVEITKLNKLGIQKMAGW